MKIVKKINLKIVIFTAEKNRCILHGRFFVMTYIIGYDNPSIMLRNLQTPPGIGFESQFLIIIINRVRQIVAVVFLVNIPGNIMLI